MQDLGGLSNAPTEPFDHRIHLFYDFTFSSSSVGTGLSRVALKDCALPDWIHPTRVGGTAQRQIADKPVWQSTRLDLSPDLHPFVRDILDSGGASDDWPQCWRLTSYGKNLLSGRYRHAIHNEALRGKATRSERFILKLGALSKLAVSRATLPLQLDDISIHIFGTGFGVAVATLHLDDRKDALTYQALVEGLPRLCDGRGKPFTYWRGEEDEIGPESSFSLGDALRGLIKPADCDLTTRDRIYSFCALVFEDKLPEAEKKDLAFRLSRHYNARYRPPADLAGTFFACPFETVLHAMSREGACTIIDFIDDGTQPVEFIGTWLEQAHPRVYLPLQIAAYHEHVVLLDLAQGAGRPIDVLRSAEPDIEALRTLGARFLLFRLRYRLSQVSRLTTHDIAYAATEHALGLTALSDKIGRDLLAVEGRLIEHATKRAEFAARRVERQWALPITIASVALTLITLNALAGAVKGLTQLTRDQRTVSVPIVVILVVTILAATFAFRWSQRRAAIGPMDRVAEHEERYTRAARYKST